MLYRLYVYNELAQREIPFSRSSQKLPLRDSSLRPRLTSPRLLNAFLYCTNSGLPYVLTRVGYCPRFSGYDDSVSTPAASSPPHLARCVIDHVISASGNVTVLYMTRILLYRRWLTLTVSSRFQHNFWTPESQKSVRHRPTLPEQQIGGAGLSRMNGDVTNADRDPRGANSQMYQR